MEEMGWREEWSVFTGGSGDAFGWSLVGAGREVDGLWLFSGAVFGSFWIVFQVVAGFLVVLLRREEGEKERVVRQVLGRVIGYGAGHRRMGYGLKLIRLN
ncbi:hypothetical protein HAX54_018230 [Datura stramonium]|uniref:Transmembrane protein n=1 Tax=Datura stramonium TaxID=4076 RepID=A0ABS8UP84_DATST|nr:hypothetical protein [Datura stramonium]